MYVPLIKNSQIKTITWDPYKSLGDIRNNIFHEGQLNNQQQNIISVFSLKI